MSFVQNFPFFSIILCLLCAVTTFVAGDRWGRRLTIGLLCVSTVLQSCVLWFCASNNTSYSYMMGHFPAPWGNEIRVGVLETVSLTVFLLVILFSFLGGMRRSEKEIEPTKYNIYCILTDLVMLSLIALVYTNDMFTAFVFIEINTLAAAGLVMMRQHGRALVAVKFDAQYSAGLDDRMKQQIIQTVQKVDDTLKDVEVTDDDTLYGQIKGLGERVANVTGLDELADDFGDLWDRIVGR